MYSVNRISIHVAAPYTPEFQGIEHLIRYLDGCPHCPIIYTVVIDGNTTHDLGQEVSPGKFHSQKISNVLVAFLDGVEGSPPNDKHAIIYVILNKTLQTIQQTQRLTPSTWPPKCSNSSNPSYKTLN